MVSALPVILLPLEQSPTRGITNIDSVGVVTARGGLEVGTSGAGGTITSAGDAVFAGLTTARFGGVTETVSVGSTSHYIQDKSVTLELDCSKGSVFTHDLSSGNVGIVSIKNFRVNTKYISLQQRLSSPRTHLHHSLEQETR